MYTLRDSSDKNTFTFIERKYEMLRKLSSIGKTSNHIKNKPSEKQQRPQKPFVNESKRITMSQAKRKYPYFSRTGKRIKPWVETPAI